jgi:hypothetical protein
MSSASGCLVAVSDSRTYGGLQAKPVLVLPDGCVAVDARLRVAARPESGRTKSW